MSTPESTGAGAALQQARTCGTCEHFGLYDKEIRGPLTEGQTHLGLRVWYRPLIDLDPAGGALCARPGRTGTAVRCYDQSPACSYYKPRAWTTAEDCVNCDLCHGRDDAGGFLCSGWPHYRKEGAEPCANGRTRYEKQLSLF